MSIKKKLSKPVQLWLEALRSGKYKQATQQLRRDKGYCCLGIACLVARKEGIISRYDGSEAELPVRVQEWLDLRTAGGNYRGHRRASLIKLNDVKGYSFEKIADKIESQPKGLFIEREF